MNTSARQHVRAAIEKVLYSDLDGTSKNLFTKLPNGVIPLTFSTLIVVPFDTETTHVLDIGNVDSANAYFNDVNLKAAAGTRVAATTLPGFIDSAAGGLQIKAIDVPTGDAPTEGEFLVILTYVEDGVEQFSQG